MRELKQDRQFIHFLTGLLLSPVQHREEMVAVSVLDQEVATITRGAHRQVGTRIASILAPRPNFTEGGGPTVVK
jgi:hypothetical protein